ncbi:MAG: helix-turn-helix transcriptional regulator [Armatimonadota bacterium]|nr:helix-turn-helix transcriptional regulator [Armatimonadota bacterium]
MVEESVARNTVAGGVDPEEPLYMIGVAAKLCDLHPQTLRTYERLGLIRPARGPNGNRMYSQADIERLRQIQRLTQELGVNLAGVEVILNLLDKMEKMRQEMEAEIQRMRRLVEEQARRLENYSNSSTR